METCSAFWSFRFQWRSTSVQTNFSFILNVILWRSGYFQISCFTTMKDIRGGVLSWLSSPCTTTSLHSMFRVQTSMCAGNLKKLLIVRTYLTGGFIAMADHCGSFWLGKSAIFWLFLLYSSHHCACPQPFSPPYSHEFCSIKHSYNALTWSRCSWPIYRKLWVSSFHLQERFDTFVCCRVTTLLLWSFTLWTVNCSSTPRISFFGCL